MEIIITCNKRLLNLYKAEEYFLTAEIVSQHLQFVLNTGTTNLVSHEAKPQTGS